MDFENLLISQKDDVLIISINRPNSLNALNTKTLSELKNIFSDIKNNSKIKGVIITGVGNKAFVAGADIKEFINYSVNQAIDLSESGQNVFNLIENCSVPVIAAVNGYALGGGCELAMSCHIRIASNNAIFGQPEVNLGLIPGYAGTQRLTQLIGKGLAIELLATGENINAEKAESIGLVNHVVEQKELMETCLNLLNKINAKSPLTITSIIKCVNHFYKKEVDGYKTEREEFGKCFSSKDFKEGTTAFLEKRKPNFKGK